MNEVCRFAPSSTPNQMSSMPGLSGTGRSSGPHDERDLEVIEEEGEEEAEEIDREQEADLASGQGKQVMFDPDVAIDAAEGEPEDGRADEDEDDHRREAQGGVHALPQQRWCEAP